VASALGGEIVIGRTRADENGTTWIVGHAGQRHLRRWRGRPRGALGPLKPGRRLVIEFDREDGPRRSGR
jgi:hypothetical protein